MTTTTYTLDEIRQRCLVDPVSGCWLWQGRLDPTGYGKIGSGYVHRVAVVAFMDAPIPDGLTVDHICHNDDPACLPAACQHRRCCNPDHLRLVSHKENVLAAPHTLAGKNARKDLCHRGHPLSGANLRVEVTRTGSRKRRCIECHREWSRNRAKSKR